MATVTFYETTRELVNKSYNIDNKYANKSLQTFLSEQGFVVSRVQCDSGIVRIWGEFDEEVLAAAVVTYKAIGLDLSKYKQNKIDEIENIFKNYIYAHYSSERQKTLTALMINTISDSQLNRRNYIIKAWSWIEKVMEYYYSIEDGVLAAESKEAIDAIVAENFDFSDYEIDSDVSEKADPGVTSRQAMLIMD